MKKSYARPYVVRIMYPWGSKVFRFKTQKNAMQFMYKKSRGIFVISSTVTCHRKVIYPSKYGITKGWK